MNKIKDLASGTFYLTLMQVLQYGVAFIFYVVVARVLSPAEVGCFSLLLMIMAVFNTLSLLALNNAVIKYVSENLGRGDEEQALASANKALKLILASSLPALAFGFSISPLIADHLKTGVFEVLSILASAFILNLTSYYGALMYGYSMFGKVSVQNVLYTISTRFSGIFLALLGLRVLGLSLGFLAGSFLTLLYSLAALKGKIRHLRHLNGFPSEKLLKFSLPLYGTNLIGLLQSWLDIAVLSSVAGLSSAGTYYIAVSSVTVLSILWQPLSSALFPTLSWINGSGGINEVFELNKKVLRIVTAVILPLSVALASASKTALSAVYGSRYAEASFSFTVLALSAILSAYASVYNVELQSTGRTKPIFKAGLASTAVYMLLLSTAVLIGQIGAALARAAMIAVGFSVLYFEAGVKVPDNLKRCILVAAFLASALIPIELFLRADLYFKASIEVLAFATVLSAAFKLLKPLGRDEMKLIKLPLSWIK